MLKGSAGRCGGEAGTGVGRGCRRRAGGASSPSVLHSSPLPTPGRNRQTWAPRTSPGHPPQADHHRAPPEPRAGGPCALHPWEQSTVAPGSRSGSTELMSPGPRMRPPRGEQSWCPPETAASLTCHVQAGSLSARGQLRSKAVPDVLVLGVEAAHGGVTGDRG